MEILVFPTVQLLDVAGPLQVFASANAIAAGRGDPPPYALKVVAAESPIVTSAGLGLVVDPLSQPGLELDTLMIAGGPGIQAARSDHRLVHWLQARVSAARRVASVCTGAFMLGQIGLLEGRRVATHWTRCRDLQREFPKAQLDPNAIFLCDGPVWSSGGVTAGIDLALALVEEDLGSEDALAVAQNLVVFPKRLGGQAQFSSLPAIDIPDERFRSLHVWMNANLTADLSVTALAFKCGMGERSFARHYFKATGLTPAKSVERCRIEAARRLLTKTELPVKTVSRRCGFTSEETFRRSFFRLLAVSPQDYRLRFRIL